ncbi:MAG: hypothetical protein EOO38_04270 [Cytophagaceae bacterium]|nr:MAG: hypothetical protein EOO38_04270 [Cytophagaceae bacterium]
MKNVATEPEGDPLSLEEQALAAQLWEALMFALSRSELEQVRLALGKAPMPVQLAVMADLAMLWKLEYEPTREENPFRA